MVAALSLEEQVTGLETEVQHLKRSRALWARIARV